MKAHLIDTHLLVPRSRSSAKVKVEYQGHVLKRWVFRVHKCFTNTFCIKFLFVYTPILIDGLYCFAMNRPFVCLSFKTFTWKLTISLTLIKVQGSYLEGHLLRFYGIIRAFLCLEHILFYLKINSRFLILCYYP